MTNPSGPVYTVVVPAYNEERRLSGTLKEIIDFFKSCVDSFELIVVDDGSRDDTARVAAEWSERHQQIRLIRLPTNCGKGYAVRTGVANALGEYVLFTDADMATPIAEIERLQLALEDGADLAIGSRAKRDEQVQIVVKLHRRLIGRVFHALVQLLAIRGFADTQCGFKLFRAPVAQDLFSSMRIRRFSFDVEILVIARLRRYKIAEVAVNWEHKPGSRINLISDSLRMARDLFVIRINRIRGVYGAPNLTPLGSLRKPERSDLG